MSDAVLTPGGAAPVDVDVERAGTRGRLSALLHNRSGLIGVVLVAIPVVLAALHLTGLTPFEASAQDPPARLQGPSLDHLFGTDQFGRDLFSRAAGGVANSAIIAVTAVALAAVVGTLAGLVAGFYRGSADTVISGGANILFAFPPLLLALSLAAVLDRSRFAVSVAIAVVYVPIFARVIRGPVLSLREVEFVTAATATGQRRAAVMLRHVLPNVAPIVIVQVTLSLSWAVLTEAALSYLGLGAPPPAPALGSMIFEARTLMYRAPSTMIFPGAALVLVVVSLNLLGDGLRDTLDPRERGRQ
jgi:peptide/nickel transport system permease protein